VTRTWSYRPVGVSNYGDMCQIRRCSNSPSPPYESQSSKPRCLLCGVVLPEPASRTIALVALTYPGATRDYTQQRVASTSAGENLREEGSGHPAFPSQMPVPLPSILLFCCVMLSLPSSPSPSRPTLERAISRPSADDGGECSNVCAGAGSRFPSAFATDISASDMERTSASISSRMLYRRGIQAGIPRASSASRKTFLHSFDVACPYSDTCSVPGSRVESLTYASPKRFLSAGLPWLGWLTSRLWQASLRKIYEVAGSAWPRKTTREQESERRLRFW
jgi:hypothetical protein